MKIESIRIRNYRTIKSEINIDLNNGLTIVGPNNSGKTNILKAIETLFTGPENNYSYSHTSDFSDGATGQTTINATLSGSPDAEDADFYSIYYELNELLESPKEKSNRINLYLSFAVKSSNPSYRLFSNEKYKQGKAQIFSKKQAQAVAILLNKFACHYVPSSKSINDLYTSLLLPFIKKSASDIFQPHIDALKVKLNEISKRFDDQLHLSGLSDIKSELKLPEDSLEQLLGEFSLHLSDPLSTPIQRKGMGIQAAAILSSFLWISNEEKRSGKNTIWLIEEPESYLHPQLTSSCLKIINELESASLVIRTTHSLGFVSKDPKRLIGTSILNGETKFTRYENYLDATSSIRSSLGVKFSDFYNLGELNIFVEGKTDREIYQWVLSAIKPEAHQWPTLRKANFFDFGGVSGIEGFLKATYEFICKERAVIVILDGDEAGNRARSNLQGYFGNKNIPFQVNTDFVSLYTGFAVEGLFPDQWIKDKYKEHPNWFSEFSEDIGGKIQPFKIKSESNKDQLRRNMIAKAQDNLDIGWADKFIVLFNAIESALEKKVGKYD